MRAILLTKHGLSIVLKIADVPGPEPAARQVRVTIRMTGINCAEVLSCKGFGRARKDYFAR